MWHYIDWLWRNVDRATKVTFWLLMASICVLLASLSGCDTAKHANKVVLKELKSHPEVVAKIAHDSFPCITVKSDTTYSFYDTTVMADCPQVDNGNQYFTLHDTAFFNNIIIKKVQVPVKVPAKIIINTVADSAQLFLFAKRIVDLNNDNAKLKKENSNKGKAILWMVIAILLLLIPYIIRAVRYFTVVKI